MSKHIPQEVIEEIIDGCSQGPFQDQEVYRTLRACCVTSRAWAQRSRYNLARRVRLQTSRQAASFANFLANNPSMVYVVSELTLSARCLGKLPLVSISRKLTNLSTISLCGVDITHRTTRYLQLPSVRVLILSETTVRNVWDIGRLLIACPMLHTLHLSHIRIKGEHKEGMKREVERTRKTMMRETRQRFLKEMHVKVAVIILWYDICLFQYREISAFSKLCTA